MVKSFITFSKRPRCIAEIEIHCESNCVLIMMNCAELLPALCVPICLFYT